MTINYGLHLPNFGPYSDTRLLASLAIDAEEAGWGGFFIWDHLARWHTRMVDPWVALTAIALNTSRILFGTMVTPLPRRRPWKLARETLSLDALSGGRLILGVGSGPGGEEFEGFGDEADSRVRGAMLDEGLEVLTGLWSGKPFSFDGAYYTVDNIHFEPEPVARPRIPIWVGGKWPNKPPIRRAMRWDGVFPVFLTSGDARLEAIRAFGAIVRDLRGSDQRPFDVIINGSTPGNDPARAAEMIGACAKAGGITWWLERIAPDIGGGTYADAVWPLEAMRERILQGPPPY